MYEISPIDAALIKFGIIVMRESLNFMNQYFNLKLKESKKKKELWTTPQKPLKRYKWSLWAVNK